MSQLPARARKTTGMRFYTKPEDVSLLPKYEELAPDVKERVDGLMMQIDITDVESVIDFGNEAIGGRMKQIADISMGGKKPADELLSGVVKDLGISLDLLNPEKMAEVLKVSAIKAARTARTGKNIIAKIFGGKETAEEKDERKARENLEKEALNVINIIRNIDVAEAKIDQIKERHEEASEVQDELLFDVAEHLIASIEMDRRVREDGLGKKDMDEDIHEMHANMLTQKSKTLAEQLVIVGTYKKSGHLTNVNLQMMDQRLKQHRDVSAQLWTYQIGQASVTLGTAGLAAVIGKMDKATGRMLNATVTSQVATNKLLTNSVTQDHTQEAAKKALVDINTQMIDCFGKIQDYYVSLPTKRQELIDTFNASQQTKGSANFKEYHKPKEISGAQPA